MKEFHAPQYFSLAEVRTHRNSNFRLHAWHYPGTPFSGWGGHYPESITPFRKSPHTSGSPSLPYPPCRGVTVQVSRRRLRRVQAYTTRPGPTGPGHRTYRLPAWPRSPQENAPHRPTGHRPGTVSTPTPSGGP